MRPTAGLWNDDQLSSCQLKVGVYDTGCANLVESYRDPQKTSDSLLRILDGA